MKRSNLALFLSLLIALLTVPALAGCGGSGGHYSRPSDAANRSEITTPAGDRQAEDAAGIILSTYPRHLTPPTERVEIRTITREEMGRIAPSLPPTSRAFYRYVTGESVSRIFFVGDQRGSNFKKDAIHEWAHLIYFRLLTHAQREEWQQIWVKAWRDGELPSPYAGTNAVEGFAEAVVALTVGHGVNGDQRPFIRRILDDPASITLATPLPASPR
jgi:predicted small lipoprotein YifL